MPLESSGVLWIFGFCRSVIPRYSAYSERVLGSCRHRSKDAAALFSRTLNVHYRLRVFLGDLLVSPSHTFTPMHSEYPEHIGLYHHHSEHIAALSFPVRTQPFGAQRFFDGLCT